MSPEKGPKADEGVPNLDVRHGPYSCAIRPYAGDVIGGCRHAGRHHGGRHHRHGEAA